MNSAPWGIVVRPHLDSHRFNCVDVIAVSEKRIAAICLHSCCTSPSHAVLDPALRKKWNVLRTYRCRSHAMGIGIARCVPCKKLEQSGFTCKLIRGTTDKENHQNKTRKLSYPRFQIHCSSIPSTLFDSLIDNLLSGLLEWEYDRKGIRQFDKHQGVNSGGSSTSINLAVHFT